jgi:hypothetical protein
MDPNSFHRLAKLLADSGEADSIDGALESFSHYGLRFVLHESVAGSVSQQVIALTAINAAARSFMGNVIVEVEPRLQLAARGFEGQALASFLSWAGVKDVAPTVSQSWPVIHVGCPRTDRAYGHLNVWASGWVFGVGGEPPAMEDFFAPSCVAAAGLAISEAFSMLRRDNPYAGRRTLLMSLYAPEAPYVRPQGPAEPAGQIVPSTWLVGLGHLGQAYAWTMGFMKPAAGAVLMLQDIDEVTNSTLSTSMLSCANDVGKKKTRVVADWLESRGFDTGLVERRFDQFQRVAALEASAALFGVDNAAARRAMEGAGFASVIDCGLGSGYKDFRAMRMRTFPGPSSAAALWAATPEPMRNDDAPAYKALVASGVDPCGVTTLASRSVGAPFVGCVAAGFAIAQRLLLESGERPVAVLDLNLRAPEKREIIRVQ